MIYHIVLSFWNLEAEKVYAAIFSCTVCERTGDRPPLPLDLLLDVLAQQLQLFFGQFPVFAQP